MTRKPLALAVVLLLAGLAPASAIIGFCTRMPCCGHPATTPVTFATEATDCCTTITCYEAPSASLTGRSAATNAALTVPVAVSGAVAAPEPGVARTSLDTSPPLQARERLAILSTLLI